MNRKRKNIRNICFLSLFCGVILLQNMLSVPLQAVSGHQQEQSSIVGDPSLFTTKDGVTLFVQRLYQVVLGREADSHGLETWTSSLQAKNQSASEVVYGFFASDEYKSKNKSDKNFVTDLYRALFDRNPDSEGEKNWLKILETQNRFVVLKGFVDSPEFAILCEKFQIDKGTIQLLLPSPSETFVIRLYKIVLGRNPDLQGVENWKQQLSSGQQTASDVVRGFFESPEYRQQNKSDPLFIRDLYRALLDRNSDSEGEKNWLSVLQEEERIFVLKGFVDSPEFARLCGTFQLHKGTIELPFSKKPSEKFVRRFYQVVLGRSASLQEIEHWQQPLLDKKMDGANLAYQFFFSPEYTQKNKQHEVFVNDLYLALLNRSPDPEGFSLWKNQLTQGVSRLQILKNLTDSPEFMALCQSYGIAAGSIYIPSYIEPTVSPNAWYNGYVDPRSVRAEIVPDPENIKGLINKYYALPNGYAPPLVTAKSSGGQSLHPEANRAWNQLYDACFAATQERLYLISGYRSISTQQYLFYNAIQRKGIAGTVKYNALPGRSEHNLGLALDLGTVKNTGISLQFLHSKAGRWVGEHGAEYGFILRYPSGKGNITGYGYEPWHFRYVGVELALLLKSSGQTLEEYYGKTPNSPYPALD